MSGIAAIHSCVSRCVSAGRLTRACPCAGPGRIGVRHAVTGAKRLQELVHGRRRAGQNLGHRCPADQAFRIDEDRLVALRQAKRALASGRLGVVGEVAGGCLLLQPLAGVAFVRPGTSRQLLRGGGAALMQGPVEPELVADVDAETPPRRSATRIFGRRSHRAGHWSIEARSQSTRSPFPSSVTMTSRAERRPGRQACCELVYSTEVKPRRTCT